MKPNGQFSFCLFYTSTVKLNMFQVVGTKFALMKNGAKHHDNEMKFK